MKIIKNTFKILYTSFWLLVTAIFTKLSYNHVIQAIQDFSKVSYSYFMLMGIFFAMFAIFVFAVPFMNNLKNNLKDFRKKEII